MTTKKNTIMIVDDSLLYRNTLAGIFESDLSVNTMQAMNAKEMLYLLKDNAPDLIIYDLFSASTNFGATMQKILVTRPETKVLVLSYETDQELVDYCFDNLAAGFVDKSISEVETILAAIKDILAGEKVVLKPTSRVAATH